MVNPSPASVREAINRQFIDYTDRLVFGELTSGGIQYSPSTDTTTASTDVTVFQKTIAPNKVGTVEFSEFGLTAEFRTVTLASTPVGNIQYRWEAKNEKDSAWTALHSGTQILCSTSFVASTMQGYYTSAVTNVPFQVRLQMNCNTLNEGRAKVHNASYVRTLFY